MKLSGIGKLDTETAYEDAQSRLKNNDITSHTNQCLIHHCNAIHTGGLSLLTRKTRSDWNYNPVKSITREEANRCLQPAN